MDQQPAPIDGLAPLPPEPAKEKAAEPVADAKPDPQKDSVKRSKQLLLVLGGVAYAGFVMWCLMLTTLLPSPTGDLGELLLIGVASCLAAAAAFLGIGLVGFWRISAAKELPIEQRKWALIKVMAIVIPGVIASGATAYLIMREPALSIDIVSPTNNQQMVAPITVSLSVQRAVDLMAKKDIRFIQYKWDVNGDAKVDLTTTVPVLDYNIERDGITRLSVTMVGSNGITRTAARRIVIQRSVFIVNPNPILVEQPAVFSIENLFPDLTILESVEWDFNGDGKADDTTKGPESTYTFYTTGEVKVSVLVKLTNSTQGRYERVLEVVTPDPPPFPVRIDTTPDNLISPPPFSVLFTIDTKEPLAEVEWDFDDDSETEKGNRVLHRFERIGNFFVTAKVRALSGSSATLHTLVRVLEELSVPDLQFEGDATIKGSTIEGAVPLRLDITPKTSVPFVQFFWEAPEATEVGSKDKRLLAVYRREGTYTLTLVGQDLANHAMRKDFVVKVLPPSTVVDFALDKEGGVAPLKVQMDATPSSIPPNDPITSYEWQCGERFPSVPSGGIFSCTYDTEGTYRIMLTIRTVSGKEYSKEKVITVRPGVLSACFVSRDTARVGSSVAFDPACTTGSWLRMVWDFGDETQLEWMPTDQGLPRHVYTKEGTYTVTETVYDALGRTSKRSLTITIEP